MDKTDDEDILSESLLNLLNDGKMSAHQPIVGFRRTAELLYGKWNTSIIMRKEDAEKHKKPHVHVESSDGNTSFDLDGNNLTSNTIKKENYFSRWIKEKKQFLSVIWFELADDNPNKVVIQEQKRFL
ncbi:MAG TPA: hypothetical protein DCL44_11390 [Elusimicrobia bacterium]|nr:hypothetical protein [Elusimicrobiota bacterium]